MNFRDLTPPERVALVDRYMAELPWLVDGTRLPDRTLRWIEVGKIALADDTLDAERRQQIRDAWLRHLDTLSEANEDEARYRLWTFWNFLQPLLYPQTIDEEEDTEG